VKRGRRLGVTEVISVSELLARSGSIGWLARTVAVLAMVPGLVGRTQQPDAGQQRDMPQKLGPVRARLWTLSP
jgi:hypothetical protein